MKEKLEEYIKDKNELKLANEILDKFKSQKIINKIRDFSLSKIEIRNIGNIQNISHDFKETTLITGDREQGKSWFSESPLWALTNKCRTSTQVLGNGKKGSVKLWFDVGAKNKYFIERSRASSGMDVILGDEKKDIGGSPDEVTNALCKIFNYNFKDKDDLFNIFYFTPKISFPFSKKDPRDVESLIIKLTNNDVWLELEDFTKSFKKEEYEKIISINGVIEHISSEEETEEEVKNKIKIYNGENEALNHDLEDLELPNVDEIKIKMSDANKKISMIQAAEEQIEQYRSSREKKARLEKENKEYQGQINHYDSMKNIMKNAEEKLAELHTQKMETVTSGKNFRTKLDESRDIFNNTDECPVLKIKCDKLESHKETIKASIDDLIVQVAKKTNQYKSIQIDIEKIEKELTESYEVGKQIHHVQVTLDENTVEIKRLDKVLSGDIKIMKEKAKKIGDMESLREEYDKLSFEYENITIKISEISEQKSELSTKIISNNGQIEMLNKTLESFGNFQKYIKDKKRFEKRQVSFDAIIKSFGKKGIPKEESVKSIKKMNKDIAYFLENLSAGSLSASIDEKFKMDVEVRSTGNHLSPKVVSDGQEWLVNLSFVLACAKMVSDKSIPFFVFDDCFAFQNDQNGEEIIDAFLKFKKEDYIKQFLLISNRSKIMRKFKDKVDDFITIKDGAIK